VYALERSGVSTGIDLAKLLDVVPWVEELLGHRLPGAVSKAGAFP
jgi:hydroxymethylglutaryl-CoA lyase